jgi:membrane-associated phospholipid phosphatase
MRKTRPGTLRGSLVLALVLWPLLVSRSEASDGGDEAIKTAESINRRSISAARLAPDILSDQRKIWSFPFKLDKGRSFRPAAGFVVTMAALIAIDPRDTPYFRRTSSFGGFNRAFSGSHTTLGILAVPTGLFLVGGVRHDPAEQQTSLRAFEALADVVILGGGVKAATGRLRPSDISPYGDFRHTWFQSYGLNVGRTAFPSGHTLAAFAVATVVADRYKHKPWVKWIAYGAAATVGLSRVTLQAHFPSDVFAGAVLGYTTAHYVVNLR